MTLQHDINFESDAKVPPFLTNRELEVLAQIANGKSRDATAIALDISPQTVKRQISVILKKFGATRLTNCMQDLIEYNKYYGKDSKGQGVFLKSIKSECRICDNFTRYKFRGTYEIMGMQSDIHSITRAFRCEGDRVKLTLDGKTVSEDCITNGDYRLNIQLPDGFSRGDIHQSTLEFEYENCALDQKLDTLIPYPTGSLSVQLHFDESSKPAKVWAAHETRLGRMVPIKEELRYADQRAVLQVTNPRIQKLYCIRWDK